MAPERKNLAEQVFFRSHALSTVISAETYAQCAHYVHDYRPYLEKKPNGFLAALEHMPPGVFSYYLHQLELCQSKLLTHPRIVQRVESIPRPDAYSPLTLLQEELNELPYVVFTYPLHNAVIVGLKKDHSHYHRTEDLLLYVDDRKIKMIELLTEFRQTDAHRDALFAHHVEKIEEYLQTFQRKQRLPLLFEA